MQKKGIPILALAAAALSPTVRTMRPQRVLAKAQAMMRATAIPTKNNGLMSSALRRLASSLKPPNGIEPSRGAVGWM